MKALVTGGGGFVGSRVAQMLADRGDEVAVLGRSRYPHMEKAGIRTIQADLRQPDAVERACAGMDIVFHVGALTGIWGKRQTFQDINVGGTKNVIDACRRSGIGRLVFTSSPSVVCGSEDICGVDESQPYPDRYVAHYPESKAAAERLILGANGPDLATVALRPHLVWGPGDPNLIPRVIARARAGKFIQLGDGTNLVDITYIDNAASAHLQAGDALGPGASVAGKAYFISQGKPVVFWTWINELLRAVGAPATTKAMSFRTAYGIGAFLELVHRCLGIRKEPLMTRFVALQLAKSHYFDISAARRDFGYKVGVSTDEGRQRLVEAIRGTTPQDQGAERPSPRHTAPEREQAAS